MKLHKILPIIFLIIAMMISCSQETVINENISGEATTPDTKICVNIKTENSRTVRPEITKWEITVTNKSDTNLEFSRTIDGKATSATFVNITAGEYEITIRGIHEDSNRKTIILTANPTFEVKPNTVNVCEIIPEDNFAYDTNGNPYNGNLSIQISGLKDLFTEGETLLLTCTKLGSNDKTSKSETLPYEYTNGTLIREISEIPVGSYKIEITHNDEAKTKTKVNLVKDPVVNIYDNTTTEINWEWNYDIDAIKEHNALKEVKIPVWNKESSSSNDYDGTFNTSFGLIGADALFAEPSNGWEELSGDFINTAYDNDGNLWILYNGEYYDDDDDASPGYKYNIKNTNNNTEYEFKLSDNDLNLSIIDFEFIKIEDTKYVLLLGLFNGSVELRIIELSENVDISSMMTYVSCTSNINGTPTSILVDGTNVYIATNTQIYDDSDESYVANNVYKGVLKKETGSTTASFTLTVDSEDNQTAKTFLSLNINDFIDDDDGNYKFEKENFKISDMYIKDSNTLYITANCFLYSYEYSGNYSFGGLFKYSLDDEGTAKLAEKYGIDSTKFTETVTDETGVAITELCDNIMQAENKTDSCFAGPRYIIPTADGKKLFIVDSGFYGSTSTDEDGNSIFSPLEERSRIFTFNTETKGLSLTTLDDSISFDYDYLTSRVSTNTNTLQSPNRQ